LNLFFFFHQDPIKGWLFKPRHWSSNQTWPLTLLVHGGPESSWNNAWSYRWNPQVLAARGYAVVMFNIHGSTGYGQEFTDSVNKNWGGTPYQDIMLGLDSILKQYDWIDPKKLSACGGSYGGYMINWILGNTNKFRSLVLHDGIFYPKGFYYTTEEIWFPEWEFAGTPFLNDIYYNKWNPSQFIQNWNTPTLIIHGGKDYRVDISQGLSTFTALRRQNIPSRLLYFAGENHVVNNPKNSIIWYQTILSWMDQWNNQTISEELFLKNSDMKKTSLSNKMV